MNDDELLKKYFQLTEIEKDTLLTEIVQSYFNINREMGYSTLEIIMGIDTMIDRAIEDENYELSQAFIDIKEAIKTVIIEWDVIAKEVKR